MSSVGFKAQSQVTVAICMWGMTRTARLVWKSQRKHIREVLARNQIQFHVFMHTWKTKHGDRIGSQKDGTAIDYDAHQALEPDFFRRDDEDEFVADLNFSEYWYENVWKEIGHCHNGEWIPELLLNHLCGMESQKRVTTMMLDHEIATKSRYDAVIFVRPDALFSVDIDPIWVHQCITPLSREVLLPAWGSWEGVNVRARRGGIVRLQNSRNERLSAQVRSHRCGKVPQICTGQGRYCD
jgi:hypothetical protein